MSRIAGFFNWNKGVTSTGGCKPLMYTVGEHRFTVIFSGELYNRKELADRLRARGRVISSPDEAQIILFSYLEYGRDFVKELNGAYAIAIFDSHKQLLLLYRDRSGITPLFYHLQEEQIVFASELKGILAFPGFRPMIDRQGLNEVFSMGPAKTYGCGVYKGISEVLPGHYLSFGRDGVRETCYWKLESHTHEDDYATTVETTTHLVLDAIERQMECDVPFCTLLSGGLDSSLVSAVCAAKLRERGESLTTFSFDFTDNHRYFKASSFQPSQDRPYVEFMVNYLGSNHKYLECDTDTQLDYLLQSVEAHDLPAMADVDSSLIYFCEQVKKDCSMTLTGECADEIFGGYPWFHREELMNARTFPWSRDLEARSVLLKDDFLEYLGMKDYVAARYEASLAEVPRLSGETGADARRREITYLNQKWVMQTLLDRMDRASAYVGLGARVPFADYRIMEYLFNIPWDMKAKDGVIKGLLRECGKDFLPDEILYRKKSPYPKTYDVGYEKKLVRRIQDILEDSSSPVLQFLDRKKVEQFLTAPSDYGKPWYGQLMAGPQMLAYVWQVNEWLRRYGVHVDLS